MVRILGLGFNKFILNVAMYLVQDKRKLVLVNDVDPSLHYEIDRSELVPIDGTPPFRKVSNLNHSCNSTQFGCRCTVYVPWPRSNICFPVCRVPIKKYAW